MEYLFDTNLKNNVQFVAQEELAPNTGHVSVEYRNSMLVWGGYNYNHEGQFYRSPGFLYIYPLQLFEKSNIWIKYKLKGDIPRVSTAACGLIHGDSLYTFGGNVVLEDNEHVRSLAMATNDFYALDLRTGSWKEITTTKDQKQPTPRDKAAGFVCSKGLFFFGGYGPSHRNVRRPEDYLFTPTDFYEDEDGGANSCWNNQLLRYDGKQWHLVQQSGVIPSHRAAASLAYNPETNKAYLFGGRHSFLRLNDLYELDVDTFKWRVIKFKNDIPKPIGRSWATLTYNPDADYFLLYGGISADDYPLNDRIKLMFNKSDFCQIEYLEMTKNVPEKRLWHSTLYINGAFISYGGMNGSPTGIGPLPPCTGSVDIVRVSPTSLKANAIRHVGQDFQKDSILKLPYLFRAQMLLLIAKRTFVKSLSAAEFRNSSAAIFPSEVDDVERDLPDDTALHVLFNSLDI